MDKVKKGSLPYGGLFFCTRREMMEEEEDDAARAHRGLSARKHNGPTELPSLRRKHAYVLGPNALFARRLKCIMIKYNDPLMSSLWRRKPRILAATVRSIIRTYFANK